MKKTLTLLLVLLVVNLFGQTKVVELTDCLKEHSKHPKEYVLNLFKTHDIVIIGERDHRDTTQYDLLLEIIGDQRFIENVGHVYTEVGCTNKTGRANRILKSTYENDSLFEEKLIELYRNLDFNPLWEKYNLYKYLKGIYAINKNLRYDNRITIGFTDLAFDWEGMDRKKYAAFEKKMNAQSQTRDSIMAANFMRLYANQIAQTGKRKALLIQSFPHAINLNLTPLGGKYRTTGNYIVEEYGEQVKIVAFNKLNYGSYNSDNYSLINKGRWDAAFEKTNCTPIGFDILDQPFGKTTYGRYRGSEIKYEELVDGILFYTPFYNFKRVVGIPNVVDKSFSNELMRRTIISQEKFINRLGLRIIKPFYKKKNARYYSNVRTLQFKEDNEMLVEQMKQWME
ncbi:MAG: hypothetical protein ACEPOZ_21275 [Marinifilaceae bacterium]